MTIWKALQECPFVEERDLLLAHVLHKPEEFVWLNLKQKLTPEQFRQYRQICKRRLKGEPYAYIVGYKHFHGLKFFVDKRVLIPRPESEWLVERTVQYLKTLSNKKPPKILDLGTGSGCIAISLAKTITGKKIQITAADVSAAALSVAKKKFPLAQSIN